MLKLAGVVSARALPSRVSRGYLWLRSRHLQSSIAYTGLYAITGCDNPNSPLTTGNGPVCGIFARLPVPGHGVRPGEAWRLGEPAGRLAHVVPGAGTGLPLAQIPAIAAVMETPSDNDHTAAAASQAGARPPLDALAQGVAHGDRAMLARAITLVESRKPEHRQLAGELLQRLHGAAGSGAPAWRIGVTGLPGVGKSTFIDQFGTNLTAAGHRVAVLAVDPTSSRSGGSILGDKTRMNRLAADSAAFIRPSPAGQMLGGVTRATRETMALCEAAGFDVIIVETVGVGQSESAVEQMVDFFLVLLLPGTGDELQGIKKGLIELADLIAINKADGELATRAAATAADYRAAMQILTSRKPQWQVPVLTISGRDNRGLDEVWQAITRHREAMMAEGEFTARRREQAVAWMHALIEDRLHGYLRGNPAIRARLDALEAEVNAGRQLPAAAAAEILQLAGFGD